MALLTHSIGSHSFVAIYGSWIPPRAEPLLDKRPGAGVEVVRTGPTAEPFTLRTVVDCESLRGAEETFLEYLTLIEQDPVRVVRDSISSDSQDFRCVVLAVRQVERAAIASPQGGLNPPSEAWLVCDWDLIAAAYTEPFP